ncbi:hypothetical protein C8R45DRAFT_1115142 [Mycena sanguinolenta]|nr:hypothetical protein C8R45DRAFT_1115142 [Mycena sanguinolenta]
MSVHISATAAVPIWHVVSNVPLSFLGVGYAPLFLRGTMSAHAWVWAVHGMREQPFISNSTTHSITTPSLPIQRWTAFGSMTSFDFAGTQSRLRVSLSWQSGNRDVP